MLWWFVQNALIAAALAVVVWPGCRVRRVGPAVRHALWLVVLLKLLTPPLVTWPWSAPRVFEWLRPVSTGGEVGSIAGETTRRENAAGEISSGAESGMLILADWFDESDSPSVHGPMDDSGAVEVPLLAIGSQPATFGGVAGIDSEAAVSAARSGFPENTIASDSLSLQSGRIIYFLGVFWLLGTAASILVHAIQVVRFTRLVARFEQPSPSLLRQVAKVAATLHVRPPRVVVVAGIRSPVIWRGVRAQLVWPECLLEARRVSEGAAANEGSSADSPRSRVGLPQDFESGRWDGVIAHELAHLRRRDHWVGWLELLAGCVWWWNPLFWYVRHQLRENAELACDALVVWALPDGRRRYAESLIEVVSHFSPVATPVPVLGVNSVARQAFERRLTMILCERVPWKLSVRGFLVVGLLALVALPGWSFGQAAPTPKSQELPAKDATKALIVEFSESVGLAEPVRFVPVTDSSGVTHYESVNVTAADPNALQGQPPSDDSRMDALEKKLEALIAEVRAMRSSRNALGQGGAPKPATIAVPAQPQLPNAFPALSATAPQTGATANTRSVIAKRPVTGVGDVQALNRGTYAMPKAKADALAAFLREHMKGVETDVKDDEGKTSLVITASPEAQATIGQFIALSEGKPTSAASGLYRLTLPQATPPPHIDR